MTAPHRAVARLAVVARSPVDNAPVTRFEDVPDEWRFADQIEAPEPDDDPPAWRWTLTALALSCLAWFGIVAAVRAWFHG